MIITRTGCELKEAMGAVDEVTYPAKPCILRGFDHRGVQVVEMRFDLRRVGAIALYIENLINGYNGPIRRVTMDLAMPVNRGAADMGWQRKPGAERPGES